MIRIGIPYIVEDRDRALLKAKVSISEDTALRYMQLEQSLPKTHWRFYENYPPEEWKSEDFGLWIAVPKEYKDFLCVERADAFVVAMLWYAIMTDSDIEWDGEISEKLAFGIESLLLPALCKRGVTIRLKGKTSNIPVHTMNKVGTGMSCGVDSLYSMQKYTEETVQDSFRLTHLCYFNMGAIFHPNTEENKRYGIEEFYTLTDQMSVEKCKNAVDVANLQGLPLIYVESNLDKDFYRGAYGYTGVYRNCAMVLALQGLFSKYYCSSAGWPEFFDLSLTEGSEHYETMLCEAFSTESLLFIISDYATRLEKTKALSDYEPAKEYLDVCFNFRSCGHCAKCYRTLITLDVLGQVDSFSKVFDVEQYKRERNKAFVWLLDTKDGDALDDNAVFAKDIYDLICQSGFTIPEEAIRSYKELKRNRKNKNAIIKVKQLTKKVIGEDGVKRIKVLVGRK